MADGNTVTTEGVPGKLLEESLLVAFYNLRKIEHQLEVSPPFVALLSILDVRGLLVPMDPVYESSGRVRQSESHPIDRDDLVFPEVIIEEPVDVNPGHLLRPIFDAIWQAGGHAGSPSYGSDGNWKR